MPIVERQKRGVWRSRTKLSCIAEGVEFNLVYDRGRNLRSPNKWTHRVILMSLPPLVRWEYGYQPELNMPEAECMKLS